MTESPSSLFLQGKHVYYDLKAKSMNTDCRISEMITFYVYV